MPFNVNQFIRRVNAAISGKRETPQPKKKAILKSTPMVIEEPKQEIVIPVYEPVSDDEPEQHVTFYKKKAPDSKITRKVSLNPLSDG